MPRVRQFFEAGERRAPLLAEIAAGAAADRLLFDMVGQAGVAAVGMQHNVTVIPHQAHVDVFRCGRRS